MPISRSVYRLDAGPRAVAGLLRAGHGGGLLIPGAEVRVGPVRLLVREVSPDAVVLAGARAAWTTQLVPDGQGTAVTDELIWPFPFGSRMLAARERVLRAGVARRQRVIVATALLRDGRVLAAQRNHPPQLAGRWELPGGGVEPGESEPDAVARECFEELGAHVRVTGRIGTDLPIDVGVLRVHSAQLCDGSPEPAALEHRALRWLTRAELPDVDWADADRAILPDVAALLDPG